MGEKINQFCNDLRDKLTAVDDRVQSFKDSVNSAGDEAKAGVQARLDKMKAGIDERKRKTEETHERIKANIEAKKAETVAEIEEWKRERKFNKLDKRARRAEEYAEDCAWWAIATVEEAEFAALEAMAARYDADEVAEA